MVASSPPLRDGGSAASTECVRVVVRCRPLNAKERTEGRVRIVEVDVSARQVLLRPPPGPGGRIGLSAQQEAPPKAFTFDAVFDVDSSQREVYEDAAAGIVSASLEGYNGTIFAYGQTGTGKTHTMEGAAAGGVPAGSTDQSTGPGIIPQAFDHIFNAIESSPGGQYLVRASFLEIYNEEVCSAAAAGFCVAGTCCMAADGACA